MLAHGGSGRGSRRNHPRPATVGMMREAKKEHSLYRTAKRESCPAFTPACFLHCSRCLKVAEASPDMREDITRSWRCRLAEQHRSSTREAQQAHASAHAPRHARQLRRRDAAAVFFQPSVFQPQTPEAAFRHAPKRKRQHRTRADVAAALLPARRPPSTEWSRDIKDGEKR